MILLYTNDCPKCKILKMKLDEKNITYETCSDMNVMMKKGFNSMPMLEVDGAVKNYLEAVNWVKGK